MKIPMNSLPYNRGAFMGFSITLFLMLSFCYCSDKSVEVVGAEECTDCSTKNIKTSQALEGIRVTISCKEGEKLKTKGVGQLDEEGKFKVILPAEFVKDDGHLKEKCFAKLQAAFNSPCLTTNDLEVSKIIFKSTDNEKHTFTPNGKLAFSHTTCSAAFKGSKFSKQTPSPKKKKVEIPVNPDRHGVGFGPIYCLHSGGCSPPF